MLASSNWRQTLQLFQSADNSHPWQLRETPMGPYLAMEGVPRLPIRQANADIIGPAVQPVLLDYHVCYSHSYQVPIMCFQVASIGAVPYGDSITQGTHGEPLSLSSLREEIFPLWPSEREQLQWFVMQQEHPLLPGPCWLSLHPCHTATVLALALGLDVGNVRRGDVAVDGGAADGSATSAVDCGGDGDGGGGANGVSAHAGAFSSAVATLSAPAEPHERHHRGATAGHCLVMKNYPVRANGTVKLLPVPSVTGQPQQAAGRGGSANEDVPDLDQLLDSGGAYSSAGSRSVNPGRENAAAMEPIESMAGGLEAVQATIRGVAVGPPGMQWQGGDVPFCESDPRSLQHYICVWFSLVGPHVGLEVPMDMMQL
ncbi:hypothetical protein VaNZ11_009703 [Volvox africanus]|uniref:Ubiquitin-like-conjugating enzyme ATG10 n=1 Tax=Volvox africanus TaxID=51714 RepID=A0ABQ5S8X1_9CHLO|nr:hypothetical protein VaNZ11_009703 [Volvox africanus]